MAKRSGITGQYISNAAAARWPRSSVNESGSGRNNSSGTHHRSTVTGRFISEGAANRNPNRSISEKN